MMRKIVIFAICVTVAFIACQTPLMAGNKSDKLKPKWLTHALPKSASGSYTFVVAHGTGASLEAAKQSAFVAMSQKLEIERGLTVNTVLHTSMKETINQKSTSMSSQQEIILEVTEKGRQLKIVCREIDDYWVRRRGVYHIDILYTVTNTNVYGGSYDDDISITAKYGAAGLLSVIPGLGQIYKGSNFKGSCIIIGEVAAVGGLILCESTRASYIKKMKEQPKYASEYNSRADKWATGRNICIGAAAAIYVYNLIDAFASTGAKRVVVNPQKYNLSLYPYTDTNSMGVGLTLNF